MKYKYLILTALILMSQILALPVSACDSVQISSEQPKSVPVFFPAEDLKNCETTNCRDFIHFFSDLENVCDNVACSVTEVTSLLLPVTNNKNHRASASFLQPTMVNQFTAPFIYPPYRPPIML